MQYGEIINNAKLIFDFLNIRDDTICQSDLIIGFGHFDMKIPVHCGRLYSKGLSKKILFTGGVGAGSADLKQPEAIEFKQELLRKCSNIPDEDIITEEKSTNTGENIIFSEKVLLSLDHGFCFQNGIKRIIAVASPYRQRRVYLALRKLYPDLKIYNAPPQSTFEEELSLFAGKGQNLIEQVVGELEKLIVYPEKGFIIKEIIPREIMNAYEIVKHNL